MLKSTKQVNEDVVKKFPLTEIERSDGGYHYLLMTDHQAIQDFVLSVRVGDLEATKKAIVTLRDMMMSEYEDKAVRLAYDSVIEHIDGQISLLKSK